jgi:hypothetical protein
MNRDWSAALGNLDNERIRTSLLVTAGDEPATSPTLRR